MRTLHLGLRVADPDRAVAFYTAVGYEVVGRVPKPSGHLTMLELPDDDVVSVELVFDPAGAGDRGTPTATGSSWSSGPPAILSASRRLTGRDSTRSRSSS